MSERRGNPDEAASQDRTGQGRTGLDAGSRTPILHTIKSTRRLRRQSQAPSQTAQSQGNTWPQCHKPATHDSLCQLNSPFPASDASRSPPRGSCGPQQRVTKADLLCATSMVLKHGSKHRSLGLFVLFIGQFVQRSNSTPDW